MEAGQDAKNLADAALQDMGQRLGLGSPSAKPPPQSPALQQSSAHPVHPFGNFNTAVNAALPGNTAFSVTVIWRSDWSSPHCHLQHHFGLDGTRHLRY